MSNTVLDALREKIVSDYLVKTPGSQVMFERARKVLPGGTSGNLRFFKPYPLYMSHGDGARSFDVDGSPYIDCFLCNGPLLLGHRHPAVEGGIAELQSVGSLVVNPEVLVTCAEKLVELSPCADQVRFLNSGTEAVMTAVRYARAYTGKDKVLKFYGHYHGQDDQFLLGVYPNRDRFGDGIPDASIENTLTLPCGDEDAFKALLNSRDDIACVILDPAMHAGGLWSVETEFLQLLRDVTCEKGVVLIFDEVIAGFRLGLGGAQEYHGVKSDLVIYGKALSGGEKLGAVAGAAEFMEVTNPLASQGVPRAFQSGTGNDGTMALAAALGAMGEYERLAQSGEYDRLWTRVEDFEHFLKAIFAEFEIDLHINRLCSMMQLFISSKPASFANYATLDNSLLDLFYLGLINHGLMLSLPTSNHVYFSFAHDNQVFADMKTAVRATLETYPFTDAYKSQL
ncbi:MAG: hypothetical protein COA81_05845 [Alphaproteobacteria bacterium]|nr:MAG: hypothetical protein COA81_05845 [Alphaproteobacteria bacterium]